MLASGVVRTMLTRATTRNVGRATENVAIDVVQDMMRWMSLDINKTMTDFFKGTTFQEEWESFSISWEDMLVRGGAYAVIGAAGDVARFPAEYANLKEAKKAYKTFMAQQEADAFFTVKTDIGEKNDLSAENSDLVNEILREMSLSHSPSELFHFQELEDFYNEITSANQISQKQIP